MALVTSSDKHRMASGTAARQRLGYSGALVGKVETGERAPSEDFAQGCDQAFPEAGGLFGRIYQLARRLGRRLSLLVHRMGRLRAARDFAAFVAAAADSRLAADR